MDYRWADKFPELHKILVLFQLTEVSDPLNYSYTPIKSILQEGPQCGLVALAMCTKKNQLDNLKSILESAKHQNFTYYGEIFSAQYMTALAKQFLSSCTIEVYEGNLNSKNIEDFLLDGGFILVPYPFKNFKSIIFQSCS